MEVGRRLADVAEIEPFVGVEIEDHPVGRLERVDMAAPAVEFDRPHLDAGEDAAGVLDIEIILDPAVLLADRDMVDLRTERSRIMLLEKALLGATLRAADEADRAARHVRQHDRRDRGIIVGKVALGRLRFGKDDAVAVADPHVGGRAGRRLLRLRSHVLRLLVLAQADEARVAHRSAGGIFGEGDFGDEVGGQPADVARRRAFDRQRRGLARTARELARQRRHRRSVEAGADIALVDQRIALALREEQRGEGARLRRRRLPADDDEFLAAGAFDLDPVARPAAGIGSIGALRDDAFLPRAAHRRIQAFARADDMVGDRDRRRGGAQQRFEPFLAFEIAQLRQRLAILFEQVEGEEVQRRIGILRAMAALDHRLQRREIGIARTVIGDDLSVDQARRQVERGELRGERRELVGPVEAVSRMDAHRAPRRRDERAIAVIFDLVEPVVAARHRIDERRELGLAKGGRLAPAGAALRDRRIMLRRGLHLLREGGALRTAQRLRAARVARDLGHGAAGEDARQMATDQIVAAAGMGVVDLAQQPVLALFARARLHADEQPFALHPFAVEREVQMAAIDVLRALARDRRPGTAVPQHHRAAAIFTLGDRALEIGIGKRMILGAHREPLVGGIGARPFRHRPALEHTVGLEAEVIMKARRVVLLDDEASALRLRRLSRRHLPRRLGRGGEVALGLVLRERVGAPRHVRRASSPARGASTPCAPGP